MNTPSLKFIDVADFPIAIIHSSQMQLGDGQKIIDDLETLIAYGEKFVLIIEDGDPRHTRNTPELHEEDKARMQWLKANNARLNEVCPAIFSPTADPAIREQKMKQVAALSTALGVNFQVVENVDEVKTKLADVLK
ncbi:hypothetical protein FW755_06180 [Lonepinella koalarum]|uniref:Uncharacterized protein n=1 Tax=Lonepinella koalarum TaxID=53417 RepID=A0A4R1KZZ6_9PAST|nr:hypothetical protein [Lonepinella koalarum]MDH2926031.1 hypothetical protein [Lonepinella koalarum]TCK71182.1 hypothetical protein EV692_0246 [Lonepinella koalarum]TFJ90910.1 hypothetical protein E0709_01230 [Lonepinella koalarum]TYG34698.1 hypothetical protein FW755_06180 [Lonepinella koalarum]